jgi:hypothetical protein
MGIQQYFIDKKVRRAKKEKEIAPILVSSIKRVLLVVDEQTLFNQDHYKELKKLMGLNRADFSILTYKEKKSNFNEFNGAIFTPDSLNWKGKITSESLNKTLEESYDLLIDYTQSSLAVQQLVVSKIKATLKVGFSEEYEELYDFTITIAPTEITTFNKEVVRYLKILKLI